MANVELVPMNLHWMEDGDPFADCCVHGGTFFSIDNTVLVDGKDDDWAISTGAFNLLGTVSCDHIPTRENALVPHCGFTMWVDESQPDGLYLPNCDLGINWRIGHEEGRVLHTFIDGQTFEMTSFEWKEVVCKFSDEIHGYFHTAWPKTFYDEMDKLGFELFMKLWEKRRVAAENVSAVMG